MFIITIRCAAQRKICRRHRVIRHCRRASGCHGLYCAPYKVLIINPSTPYSAATMVDDHHPIIAKSIPTNFPKALRKTNKTINDKTSTLGTLLIMSDIPGTPTHVKLPYILRAVYDEYIRIHATTTVCTIGCHYFDHRHGMFRKGTASHHGRGRR